MIYPWTQPLYQRLSASLSSGSLPHALLFHGPSGCGKFALAREVAHRLLCSLPLEQGETACGECRSCTLLNAGTHPDLLLVEGEEGTISVDQVRAVTQWVQLRAQHRAKVVLIKGIEQMTPSASNALLKVLEEPPSDSRFILTTDRFSALLPTIVSRCQLWRVEPGFEPAQSYLMQNGFSVEQSLGALRLFGGAPLSALEWLQSERTHKPAALAAIFSDWSKGNATTAELITALTADPRWFTLLLADLIKCQSGINDGTLFDERLLRQLASRFASDRLFALFHQWSKLLALKEQSSGINFPLQVTALLVSLKLP